MTEDTRETRSWTMIAAFLGGVFALLPALVMDSFGLVEFDVLHTAFQMWFACIVAGLVLDLGSAFDD